MGGGCTHSNFDQRRRLRSKRRNSGKKGKNISGFAKRVGSRAEVYHGKARKTTGGLTKGKLFKDKYGRIRSLAASNAAKGNENLGRYLEPENNPLFKKESKKKGKSKKRKSSKKRKGR